MEAPPQGLAGYPEADATGVPTDVRPIFQLHRLPPNLAELSDPPFDHDGNPRSAPLELVDANGNVTSLSLGTGGGAWYLELVPAQPLQPDTRYELRTATPTAAEVRLPFTTGSGPVAAPPAPPQVTIEHYQLDQDWSSACGSLKTGTCSIFPEPEPGAYVQAVGFDRNGPADVARTAYLSRTPRFHDIAGIDQGSSYDCLEFRNRAANGALSEPVIRCREDGALYDLGDIQSVQCTAAGILTSGVHASELARDSGCSVVPGRSPASWLGSALPLLGLLALPSLRRRARAARR